MPTARRSFLIATAGAIWAAASQARAADSAGGDKTSRRSARVSPASPAAFCDYAASYVTFVTRERGNMARLQVESRLMLLDEAGKPADEFFQFASCKAEHTYAEADLFQDPNYDFSGIFSRHDYVIFRAGMPQTGPYAERGAARDRFDDVLFHIQEAQSVCTLGNNAAIVKATLEGRPLVGRTEFPLGDGGWRAMLEYPIKTMNVNDQRQAFQVDTGPLVFADPQAEGDRTVDRLQLAYVAFNRLDEAYFIVQRPTTVSGAAGAEVNVCHYGDIRRMPVVNSLVCL